MHRNKLTVEHCDPKQNQQTQSETQEESRGTRVWNGWERDGVARHKARIATNIRTSDNRRISLRFSKPGEGQHETHNEKHYAHNQPLVAFYGRGDLVLARNQLTKQRAYETPEIKPKGRLKGHEI
jgi:hypothetical protein